MSKTEQQSKTSAKFRTKSLVLFMVGALIVGYLAGYFTPITQSTMQSFINQYPYLDPARHFIAQEHYLATLQPLREEARRLAGEYGDGNVSIYIEYLNTGANISINPDLYLWSASLPKLSIGMAVLKKIEAGELTLETDLQFTQDDLNALSGSTENPIWNQPVGTNFSVRELLQQLLANSDNTAQAILVRNISPNDMEKIISDLGLEKLFDDSGKLSAKEYSRFLRSLYTASYLNREHSQMVLGWLDESTFNDFLAQSIPQQLRFPHKYGENFVQRVYADSGIVYVPNRPYLITVILRGDSAQDFQTDKTRATIFMQKISKAAYDYLSQP